MGLNMMNVKIVLLGMLYIGLVVCSQVGKLLRRMGQVMKQRCFAPSNKGIVQITKLVTFSA